MDSERSGPETADGKVAWLWRQVEQARDGGDVAVARESLSRLLADPRVRGTADEDLAMLHLCQLELEEGRVAEVARRMTDFSWNIRPGPAALLLSADVYMKLDWFAQSLESLDRYLREIPDDLDARRKKGLVLLMLDRDDEAERALLSVARRERYRVPATLAYLAMLEAKNDRLEESLHLLMQARDLAPFDSRIEHTLLRVEALRVRLRRKALSHDGLPLEDVVGGMVSGMMELHGYTEEQARYARDVWNHFCAVETPTGRKPAIWAAALEYAVTRNGPHLSQEELADEYGVSASQLREHYKSLTSSVDLKASGDLLAEAASQGSALSSLVHREELADILAGAVRRLSDFETEAEAVAWVFDRMDPAGEEERREVEDFLRFIWNRRR